MSFEEKLEDMEKGNNYIAALLNISPIMYYAIESLKNNSLYNELAIEVIDMSIQSFNENSGYGLKLKIYLPIKPEIERRLFLSFECAENLTGPFGSMVADEIIYPILKEILKELGILE